MTTTTNTASQGISWTVFGAECLQAVNDLRWMIIFSVILIGFDFWWGCRELALKRNRATREKDKERYKFHFSQAGRRTLNKLVDYLSYLLIGCVAGLAITEPMGLADHTTTAAIGLGFGCLFEISSIVGHIAVVKGINIRLNLKRLLVAIIKHKSEELAEVIDEGIEEIEDNRQQGEHLDLPPQHRHRHGDSTISPTYGDDDIHHSGEDINEEGEQHDETEQEL